MHETHLNTPVIFLVFKRPDETAMVFEQIRKARPNRLFIVADGPRNDIEKIATDEVRALLEKIDWPCEVYRNYSEANLGCRKRVWSGLDWAFDRTDRAIILEDDCLPDQSFFQFCEELLDKYADNPQVMHIAGMNFQQDNPSFSIAQSYYFSHIAQIWGWATWKRAWKKYDGNMSSWSRERKNPDFKKRFPSLTAWHYWRYVFDKMRDNKFDTWDIAWTYTCYKEEGLCIMPKSNLVTNIGFGASATHSGKSAGLANVPVERMHLPLTHPAVNEVNQSADEYTLKKVFGINPTALNTVKLFIKDLISG